jgi:DNA polymerase elongation subunit (family B)
MCLWYGSSLHSNPEIFVENEQIQVRLTNCIMARQLQPCDWYEHDAAGKYVVDVFGRTDEGMVACLRINGFKPYFYVRGGKKPVVSGTVATIVEKYDVFAGFNNLKKIEVWKVVCDTKAKMMEAVKACGNETQLYESGLPPFIRLFHDRHLSPASPLKFVEHRYTIPSDRETEDPLYNIDAFYQCQIHEVESIDSIIALKVASYDLEMYSASGMFPRASGDPIVQIGISYRWSDKMLDPVRRVVFVAGTVDKAEEAGVEFIGCKNEEDMLYKFAYEIRKQNPDVMCGYNTFGFDDAYIEDRCRELGIIDDIDLSRFQSKTKDFHSGAWKVKFSETKKFELASGKYDLRFLTLRGRLGLDLLLNMRREHSLDSFKLDNVASTFLRDKVVKYANGKISTKSTRGLVAGNYVKFDIVGNTSDPYRDGHKFNVKSVDPKGFTIDGGEDLFDDLSEKDRASLEWTFTKDDVEPHELFRLHREGGPAGRARIAKYCIQDCDLVLTLMAKLDTIVNARGMADVCKVPMEYVLRRGQGIKIFSAVVYYASQRDQILQTQSAADWDTGYEGAIVLPPKIGMYLDQPISVLDFNSLYPTNMISYNLSPDTLVYECEKDVEGYLTKPSAAVHAKAREWMETLREQGHVLEEVDYDNKDEKGVVIGKTICTFVQPNENPMTVGVLPKTLDILLKKRKEFKEKMEDQQYDEAQRSVYNGLQLAYKVVANSVYGQTGSRTSPIRKLCVAACTTAAGRKALYLAKSIVEDEYGAEVIYGDTDSIFIKFPTKDLAESIRLGIDSGKRITSQCRKPYKIAYEKTFYPFILFCRKRYVGLMYEEDATIKPKRKSMGIVLKRRDNAPIVKDIFGGALDMLLTEKDVKKAQAFTNEMLLKVLQNKVPLEKFIISKSLRDDYITTIPPNYRKKLEEDRDDLLERHSEEKSRDRKAELGRRIEIIRRHLEEGKTSYNKLREWAERYKLPVAASTIAHRTLADRMEGRDPGTAPKVGDRLAFVFVDENKAKGKQGDRIEEVGYVRQNGLKPDTEFYITNQIQNPVSSLFALCIDQLDGYIAPSRPSYTSLYNDLMVKYHDDEEEATRALLSKKEKQLDSIMFLGCPTLSKIVRGNVRGPMDAFLRRK